MTSGRFYSGLRFKIAASVIVVLVVIMSIFFSILFLQYRVDLLANLRDSSTHYLSNVIKGSLKHAMLTRDSEEISYIIDTVSGQPSVRTIFLVNKEGEIMVSPEESMIGKKLSLDDPTCRICHQIEPESRSKTVILTADQGETERIFRNVNPIINEPECHQCHDAKNKLNGVLITDFSMADVGKKLSMKFREMLLSLSIMTLVTAVTISLVMNRMVLSKLDRFLKATKLFSMGDLQHKVELESEDEIGKLASSFNEMIENLRKSREIRERKELLENVLNNVSESIIMVDPEGNIISFSRGAEEMDGCVAKEVIGTKYSTFCPERERVWDVVGDGNAFSGEIELRRKEGPPFPAHLTMTPIMDDNDKPLVFVEVARNLTEEKAKETLQQKLMLSEKLAAMGQLAAGVAHELNNPLGHIMLYSKLLMEEIDTVNPNHANITKIVANVTRCKKIVSDLLDYTRQTDLDMEMNDINAVVEKCVGMLENQMKVRNIESKVDLDVDLPSILCDRSRMQQVLINLIQNAIQAIGADGKVTIFTRKNDGADGIVVGVEDTGPGITAESISKIFEPFYTTKAQGSGLGLSICHGIVQSHGGKIRVESRCANGSGEPSQEGAGTTVCVELFLPQ